MRYPSSIDRNYPKVAVKVAEMPAPDANLSQSLGIVALFIMLGAWFYLL